MRFRITNTSPIPTSIRVTVPGSGAEAVLEPPLKANVPNSDSPAPLGKFVSASPYVLPVGKIEWSKMIKESLDANHEYKSVSFQVPGSVTAMGAGFAAVYHETSMVVPVVENVTSGAVGVASRQGP